MFTVLFSDKSKNKIRQQITGFEKRNETTEKIQKRAETIRNEIKKIEKRNETKRNETKRNEKIQKRNETKKKIKGQEMKRNEKKNVFQTQAHY
jgi:hypothetical protein